jgi:tryptophan 2,3-dioxygenase
MNPEDAIRAALADFDVADYLVAARSQGRAELPSSLRHDAAVLYRRIVDYREHHSQISRTLDDILDLAQRFLSSEAFFDHTPVPRYRAYTNLSVLNWYLCTIHRTPYQRIWKRCVTAIQLLLHDLLSFEVNSLAGLESRGADSFDPATVRHRVGLLRSTLAAFSGSEPNMTLLGPCAGLAWDDYVTDAGAECALLQLTAFPQTSEHDEYLFLRSIHISECCFWGVLTATLAAAEQVKRGDLLRGASCLHVALPFAALLTPLFQILKTMPPEHFRRFRAATGQASAVQSRTYQLMQIVLVGANPATIGFIADVDDLQGVAAYDHPAFPSLASLLKAAIVVESPAAGPLREGAAALDKELRKWRTLHLGIARKYLADLPMGTGGSSGPSYLKLSVQHTMQAAGDALNPDGGHEAVYGGECDEHDAQWRQTTKRPVFSVAPPLSRDN